MLGAIECGDRAHIAEELGDVLLQVAFHARVAQEQAERAFDIDDVAGLLVDKLVRRHPHVFADGDASTPAEVEQAWERIKAQEKGAGHRRWGRLCGRPAARHPRGAARRARRREGARAGAPSRAQPLTGAVARLERARAALRRPRPTCALPWRTWTRIRLRLPAPHRTALDAGTWVKRAASPTLFTHIRDGACTVALHIQVRLTSAT